MAVLPVTEASFLPWALTLMTAVALLLAGGFVNHMLQGSKQAALVERVDGLVKRMEKLEERMDRLLDKLLEKEDR